MKGGRVVALVLGLLPCLLIGSCAVRQHQAAEGAPVAPVTAASLARHGDLLRCTTLASHWANFQIGAGAESQWIMVTDTGDAPCSLSGLMPKGFVALGSGGHRRRFHPSVLASDGLKRVTVLRPGRPAWFQLRFGDPGNCGHPKATAYDRVRFRLGAGEQFSVRLPGAPLTFACGGAAVSRLVRPPFAAATRTPR